MGSKSKLTDLLEKLKSAVDRGSLRFSKHTFERMSERGILRREVRFVLKNGFHEKRKDQFDEEYNCWNYSIRGKTLDDRKLRIVVSFEKPNFIVVTAIDLER